MREVTDASFEQEILGSKVPVVVDFWAPWCRPCRAVAPIFEELEQAAEGRVAFAKLDIDENPVTASRYDVLSIPTAILFAGGDAQETVIGAYPRSKYEQVWGPWLASSSATEPP